MIKEVFSSPWAPLVALTEQGLSPVHKKLNGNHLDHYAKTHGWCLLLKVKLLCAIVFNRGREEGREVFKSLSTTGSSGCNTN